jgi:hypothetical protein
MKEAVLHFDINKGGKSFAALVRARAVKAGSKLVYVENDQLIEENPRTGEKVVIKSYHSKAE